MILTSLFGGMHTDQEVAEAEMARLERVLSNPKINSRPKVVVNVKKDEPVISPRGQVASPRRFCRLF